MSIRSVLKRKRRWVWAGGIVAGIVLVLALVLFQPWLLFIDVEVDDALPVTSSQTSEAEADKNPSPAESSPTPTPPSDTQASVVSSGEFISHEHETTGTARIVEFADGRQQLVLENLATTNGPDVHVWLSAGPAIPGFDGWFTAGQHEHVDLGLIKGNLGDQVYDIPEGVDLAAFPTIDLWCEQFAVSFGAAALIPN